MKYFQTFILLICVLTSHAQRRDLKNANLAMDKDYFTDAIYLYDLVLKNKKSSQSQLKRASRKKALALYRNIDYRKAKDQWDQYVADFGYTLPDIELFYYAQSLIQCDERSGVREVLNNVEDVEKKAAWTYNLIDWRESLAGNEPEPIGDVGFTNIEPFHKGVGLATDGESIIIPRHSFEESAALIEDYTQYQLAVYEPTSREEFEQNNKKLECLTTSSRFFANPYTDGQLLYFGTVFDEKKKDEPGRKLRLQSAVLSCKKNLKTRPLDLGFKGSNNSFPFLYQDTIMFFASDKGERGFEIMYSIWDSQGWSSAKTLEEVNTFENDIYPMVHMDKFYFSSKGREGFGGMDIYRGDLIIEDQKIRVENIENVGQPINSGNDDFALVFSDEDLGYFMSNRSDLNLDHVLWVNLNNGEEEPPALVADIQTRLIFFERESAELSTIAKTKLDQIGTLLQQRPELTLKLEGHADTRGSSQFNLMLSEKRNITVAEYLSAFDVTESRIEAEAFGETRPINTCGNGNWCHELEYELNRRVRINVIYDQPEAEKEAKEGQVSLAQ